MATNLIDFLRELLFNDDLREQFTEDPAKTLAANGLSNVSADDIHDGLALLHGDDGHSTNHHGANHQVARPVEPHHHGGHEEAAAQYLNRYITNNYTDARETHVDQSLHQDIDTDGADLDQHFDNHSVTASGDGGVAAGHSITGTVTTGDDNQVGLGNVRGDGNVTGTGNHAVTGSDNTTSFGSGAATSSSVGGDLRVGNGSAVSGTGTAGVTDTDNSVDHAFNDQSDHSTDHAFNDESDHSDHSNHSLHHAFDNESDSSTHSDTHVTDSANLHA